MAAPHPAMFLLATLVGPNAGAGPAPSDQTAIVVQGTREREKQISRFIKSLTPAPVRGQTARFESAVCPVAVGLPDRQNEYIAERMRQVAKAANIAVAKPDCQPNVILIVTNDKASFLKRLARQRPDYFPADWSVFKLHEIQRDPAPATAWYLEGKKGSDGREITPDYEGYFTQKGPEGASRLIPAARHYFGASVVVVQADALAGLTTLQLADYAAMRAFVRTDPKQLRETAADSILKVIEAPMGTPVPLTLTAWDLGFLKAFYASGKNSYVEYQRAEMQKQMRRHLDRQQ
jgi:hypothetical protein